MYRQRYGRNYTTTPVLWVIEIVRLLFIVPNFVPSCHFDHVGYKVWAKVMTLKLPYISFATVRLLTHNFHPLFRKICQSYPVKLLWLCRFGLLEHCFGGLILPFKHSTTNGLLEFLRFIEVSKLLPNSDSCSFWLPSIVPRPLSYLCKRNHQRQFL